MLLNKDQLVQSEKRFNGLQDAPTRENPLDIREEAFITTVAPEVIKDNLIGSDENMVKRKQMLAQQAKEPVDFALERAIGKNDSVYSNFIELIAYAKKRVVRIECKRGNRPIGSATGFMVTDQLMLTNWHVFKTIETVGDSEAQFFYELDIKGSPGTYTSFKLAANTFFYSNKELDYCFVAVNPIDLSGKKKLADMGWLYLDPGLGKLGNESEEALNIIHHPDGDYKQISIRENIFQTHFSEHFGCVC